MKVLFINGNLIYPDRIEKGNLCCCHGKFISNQEPDEVVDLKGSLVAPGYIDLQINGIEAHDFTSSPESIGQAAAILPRFGVTSFLPTLISSTPAHYQQILPTDNFTKKGDSATILGFHLEGPFLNPAFCGAHDSTLFRNFDSPEPLLECYGSFKNVKLVTLAPELPNALRWIKYLISKGIKVSAGHTGCSMHEYMEGCKAGISMVTHLYNAMTPFHHRSPGIIGAVLSNRKDFYSLIVDGIHVDPVAVKMAWNGNSQGLILISDSIGHTLHGRQVQDNHLKDTATLAGSKLTMDQAVRLLIHMTDCSISEAVAAATFKPATFLGIETNKGQLKEGGDADFILLDNRLEVTATFIAGKQVFRTAVK